MMTRRIATLLVLSTATALFATACTSSKSDSTSSVETGSSTTQQPDWKVQKEDALTRLKKAPNSIDALKELATAELNLAQPDSKTGVYDGEDLAMLGEAADALKKIHTIDPNDSFSQQLLADTYNRMRDFKMAAQTYGLLVTIDPKNKSTYLFAQATAAQNAGDKKQACATYHTFLKTSKKGVPLYKAATQGLEQLGC